MKNTILTIALTFCGLSSFAQTDLDALRYSLRSLSGSARTAAIGGAAGAMGADVLSMAINPAGIAQYRSNEWNIGLAYNLGLNEADYLGSRSTELRSGVNIPATGAVFTNLYYDRDGKLRKDGWVNLNWGMSFQRSSNYNRTIAFDGINDQNSFLDHIAERSQGLSTLDFGGSDQDFNEGFSYLEDMFWWAYLIDSSGPGEYIGFYDPRFNLMEQRGLLRQEGRSNEWHMSLAANYSNKVYLGGGLNISRFRYEERIEFQEIDDPRTDWNFNEYSLERSLSSRGTGLGMNLGVIVLPTENLRAGVSLQIPTLVSLNDEYSDELNVLLDNGERFSYRTRDSRFDYELSTPLRTTVSAAYLFGKKGLISADVEMLNYQSMRLNPEESGFGSYFATQNSNISAKYDRAVNLRLGGEWNTGNLRFRAGYANEGSPFRNNPNFRSSQYAAGFGIREGRTALDLAYVHTRIKDVYFPYQLNKGTASAVYNNWTNSTIMLSLSGKF